MGRCGKVQGVSACGKAFLIGAAGLLDLRLIVHGPQSRQGVPVWLNNQTAKASLLVFCYTLVLCRSLAFPQLFVKWRRGTVFGVRCLWPPLNAQFDA